MQKKLLTLVLMLIVAINTFAYDFESNGIYYKILSKKKCTCAVTNQSETSSKKYAGNIVIPSTVQDSNGVDYTVSAISDFAFQDCVKLQNVVLPNTIQSVGQQAFENCVLLESIVLPQSVTTLGYYSFRGCISIESIDFGSIEKIEDQCLAGCSSIDNLVIPNTVTEIGQDAFQGCSSLSNIIFQSGHKKLYLSDYNNEGPLFAECSLDSVFIGRNLTSKTDVAYIESSPFSKSKMLRSVYVSDSVTYIGKYYFRDCENLEHVYGMNKVDSIGELSFAGTKIKKFCAPSLRTFEENGFAFDKCQNLEEIVLGKIENVTNYYIGDCPNLRNIYIGTELRRIGSTRFFENFRGKLYIFSDKLSEVYYKEAYDHNYTQYGQSFTTHYPAEYGIPSTVEAVYVANPERYQSLLGKFYNVKPMLSFKESVVEYSGKTPELTFVNNVDGYDVTFDKSTTPKDAGTYKTNLDVIFSNHDWNVSVAIPCSYTITKAPLTIIPNSIKRNYGEENPELSCTYIGFKNKETYEVLEKVPNVYTIATSSSDVGTYPIYCSDAEAKNYAFDYKQGMLTIDKAKQEIIWEQDFANAEIGETIELTATSNSGLSVKYRSTDLSTVMISSQGGKQYASILKAGTAVLTAYQNGDTNYEEADEVNKIINIQNTSIDAINNGNEKIAVENGSITISQIKENEIITVTNLSGRTMFVVHAEAEQILKTPTLAKGIYILSIGSKNYKVAIP